MESMSPEVSELFEAALAVRERSHSPYSNYAVGAALRTRAGDVFAGCNVENAAFPSGICAEAGAIAAMIAGSPGDGAPVIDLIVTVTIGDTPGTPCGNCRQRIREFSDSTTSIVSTNVDGAHRTWTMDEILPDSFGPDRLL